MALALHTLHGMTEPKTLRTTLILPPEVTDDVNQFRFDERFPSRNDAIVALIVAGLDEWKRKRAKAKN